MTQLKLPLRVIVDKPSDDKILMMEIHAADGGYYLYQYVQLNDPPKWDTFYESLDDLTEDCFNSWGISLNSWHTIDLDVSHE